jgi:hypothetical protein
VTVAGGRSGGAVADCSDRPGNAIRADRPDRAAQLSPELRQVYQAILRHFASTGTAPQLDDLAPVTARAGLDPGRRSAGGQPVAYRTVFPHDGKQHKAAVLLLPEVEAGELLDPVHAVQQRVAVHRERGGSRRPVEPVGGKAAQGGREVRRVGPASRPNTRLVIRSASAGEPASRS